MSLLNVVLLVFVMGVIVNYMGVFNYYFMVCWMDIDIISREKWNICEKVNIKVFNYKSFDVKGDVFFS